MAKRAYWTAVYAVPTTGHGAGDWIYCGRAGSVSEARVQVRLAGHRIMVKGGLAQRGPDLVQDSTRDVYIITTHPRKA